MRRFGVLATLVALWALPAAARAFSVTDVTFQIPPDDPEYADAAELLPGNDDVDAINDLGGEFSGDPWVLLDKTDDPANEFMGVTFELTADVDEASGNWTLSWTETGDPGLPLTMDFVFVTKAANDWGAYLFESVTFTTDPTTGLGTFEITWTNNGGNIPDLSHASIYARASTVPPEPVSTPAPVLLLILGLALLARSRMARPFVPPPGPALQPA